MGNQQQPAAKILLSHLASHGNGWQLSLQYEPFCQVTHVFAGPALFLKKKTKKKNI